MQIINKAIKTKISLLNIWYFVLLFFIPLIKISKIIIGKQKVIKYSKSSFPFLLNQVGTQRKFS